MNRAARLVYLLLVIGFGLGLFACAESSSPPPIIPAYDGAAAEASAGDAGPGDAPKAE